MFSHVETQALVLCRSIRHAVLNDVEGSSLRETPLMYMALSKGLHAASDELQKAHRHIHDDIHKVHDYFHTHMEHKIHSAHHPGAS